MENHSQTVYILDSYNKFEKDDVVELFTINSQWYAIKRVYLNFGKPILSSFEKNEDESISFHLFNTLEEAQLAVKRMKKAELLEI